VWAALGLVGPPHGAVELMPAFTFAICASELTLGLRRTMKLLATRLVVVAAATSLLVGTGDGESEELSKGESNLLRKQAAGAVEGALTAVVFDERASDVEDAFSAATVEVTGLSALVEMGWAVAIADALGGAKTGD
jgi:hypothetical protein